MVLTKISYLPLVALLSMVLLIPACKTTLPSSMTSGLNNNKQGEGGTNQARPKPQSMTLPIGTVHMVDKNAKFALIKSSRSMSIEPGTKITTYSPSAQVTAQLEVSPARKGAYLTADFVEGVPTIGDSAMMVHTVKRPDTPNPESPTPASDIQVLE